MTHFIKTLRQLYTVKVDWNGSKYLGMTIDINRKERYVTLFMPGYTTKLLRRVRPQGVKSATTPATYIAPNYKSPKAQIATIDELPSHPPHNYENYKQLLARCCTMLAR
jgi:hypothetical protein